MPNSPNLPSPPDISLGERRGTHPLPSLSFIPARRRSVLTHRIQARGKFFFAGEEKFYVRGVTYGPFQPEADASEYHTLEHVRQDFEKIAAWGFNTVRVYTVPPRWLLDIAAQYGLRVMIGLPWEQHITFLDDRRRVKAIERKVEEGVRVCAGHPAVFGYCIGNEIPAPVVRWHGAKRIEKFLHHLYKKAKALDPNALFTYVNYPTTEYLQLPFLDFVTFNVYLETEDRLEAYLYRLQNLSDERPLLMAELGLDSRRNGEEKQAETLDWQVRTAFRTGTAGLFIFSWTDEWFRGGYSIEDWDFGLIRRDGTPKPALHSVAEAMREVPFDRRGIVWPRFSVVVCTYNGSRIIRDCLEGLAQLNYPNFEVIIVNDGSTDETEEIIKGFTTLYGFRLISTPNRGLSNARNTGAQVATGELIAYLDDDARPDPHWLQYLAMDFMRTKHAAIGGPNIPPPGDGLIAECVANSPGGPAHVLLTDRTAEHIPGCNMAYRKSALQAVGGFDSIYRQAGDDVDLCWRILERGWTIGFSPSAMVWHHRRNSIRMYWKQQYGYGKAEALLEEKYPERFNGPGHLTWGGRVYNKGLTLPLIFKRGRIYQGVWGSAPFQSLYQPAPTLWASLVLMPEWYLVIGFFASLSALSLLWPPLEWTRPLFGISAAALILQAILSARRATFTEAVKPLSAFHKWGLHGLTAFLHLIQPLARLHGRIDHGLTIWRRTGPAGFALPLPRKETLWSEEWREPHEWLKRIETIFRDEEFVVRHGNDYDCWDLEVRSGMFGAARVRVAVEDHGAGKQNIQLRAWPYSSRIWGSVSLLFLILSAAAGLDQAWPASLVLGGAALLAGGRILRQSSCAMAGVRRAVVQLKQKNA